VAGRSPRPRPGAVAPQPAFPLVPLLIAVLTEASMAVLGAPLARQVLAHAEDRPASVADVPAGANAAGFVAAPVAGPARCLAGTWRETRTDVVVQGVHFVGSGAVVRFNPTVRRPPSTSA
jgi:hypothetical protein